MNPRKANTIEKEKVRRVPTLARTQRHRTGCLFWKLLRLLLLLFLVVLLLYLASAERHCSFQFVFDNVEHPLHAFLATYGEGEEHRPPQQHRGRSCKISVWGSIWWLHTAEIRLSLNGRTISTNRKPLAGTLATALLSLSCPLFVVGLQ